MDNSILYNVVSTPTVRNGHNAYKMPWHLYDVNNCVKFFMQILQPRRVNAQVFCNNHSHHAMALCCRYTCVFNVVHIYVNQFQETQFGTVLASIIVLPLLKSANKCGISVSKNFVL